MAHIVELSGNLKQHNYSGISCGLYVRIHRTDVLRKGRRLKMDKFKNSLIAFVGLAAFIGAIAAVMPVNTKGQGGSTKPPQDVNVVNMPSVNLANTPTVNSQQSGAWTIGINSSQANPVSSRDVDQPARQPFQRFLVKLMEIGESNAGDSIFFPIPPGKRLVIEFVTFIGGVPEGQNMRVRIDCIGGGQSTAHHLTLTNDGPFDQGTDIFYKATQQMRAYADPGTNVYIRVIRNGTAGTSNLNISVSGHLVDVP
jgi:hypothetical protein